ncbi:MAG: hypothetical protein IKE01_02370 [Clostridia bacterium]|nr:hypothetical protein [Clostridia bacterium]
MVEIELKSNVLKEDVYLKLNKDRSVPLYDEDLNMIDHLNLNALDFIDEPTDVTLYDLVFFKNLKSCCIINKEISDNELNVLNSLENIKIMQFSKCRFPSSKVKNLSVECIILDGCPDINISTFDECKNIKKFRIVNCTNINLKGISKFVNLTDLYIQNMNLEEIDEVMKIESLQYLNLNGTSVEKNVDFSQRIDLIVEHEKENYLYG